MDHVAASGRGTRRACSRSSADPRVPDHPPGPHHSRNRPDFPTTAVNAGGCRGCVARRSRCSPACRPTTTHASSGERYRRVRQRRRGVARALQLDEAERSHLYDLIRTCGGTGPTRRRGVTPGGTTDGAARRRLDARHPAVVSNGRLDILHTNTLGRALFAPVSSPTEATAEQRPVRVPRPGRRGLYREWDAVADDTVALLRAEAGRNPHDENCPTSSASCRSAAPSSAPAGPPTTFASTHRA